MKKVLFGAIAITLLSFSGFASVSGPCSLIGNIVEKTKMILSIS